MERMNFLNYFLAAFFIFCTVLVQPALEEGIAADNHKWGEMLSSDKQAKDKSLKARPHVTLFMTGDVMTGRGIDQVLPHPSDPVIYEGYLKTAKGYVQIAEEANGPIPRPSAFRYIWGDALEELQRRKPDLRLINLETSVTASNDY